MSIKVRFTETPDGWLDTQTGLEWSKTLGEASWNDAQLLIPEGWRLPTITELFGVVDYTRNRPATELLDTQSFFYWSSTTTQFERRGAWSQGFGYGSVSYDSKANKYAVRAVRRRYEQLHYQHPELAPR